MLITQEGILQFLSN